MMIQYPLDTVLPGLILHVLCEIRIHMHIIQILSLRSVDGIRNSQSSTALRISSKSEQKMESVLKLDHRRVGNTDHSVLFTEDP